MCRGGRARREVATSVGVCGHSDFMLLENKEFELVNMFGGGILRTKERRPVGRSVGAVPQDTQAQASDLDHGVDARPRGLHLPDAGGAA